MSETPPWFAPPTSELPVAVAIAAVLARREGVALCLRRIDVYRDGWRFAFSIRAARPEKISDDVLDTVQSEQSFVFDSTPLVAARENVLAIWAS
jgi:hypothetical protein